MLTSRFKFQVPGLLPRTRKPWFTTLMVAACAATLAFTGCSKAKSVTKSDPNPVDPGTDPKDKPGVGTVTSAIDSLVQKNKGKGLGVVTGYLTGEGSTLSKLFKQAANAAGERRLLEKETVPLQAATVLIFDALKPTTQADTTLKTDDKGNYTVVLPEGKYFGFAVYLDLETFSLVTTQIPNISPKADTIVKMDTAIAIEDVTAPSVTSVYDAMAPNDDNIFLVGSIPATGAKVNITFSEPMNRDAAKGVLLGRIDTSNTSSSLVLADTVEDVTLTWSGDSKELTLNAKTLDVGVQYGVIIPVACKDLAKNPLDKQFGATFVTAKTEDLAKIDFAVSATTPNDGDGIKPIQNPAISFNRPVDVFSIMKEVSIAPNVVGFWEVSGARATFVHKDPFKVGETYTIKIPVTVKDLGGTGLKEASSLKFTVKDFDGAAKDKTGDDKTVALTVEAMFDAYVTGDLGRFGTYFHPNFRMMEGSKILSRSQFLDARRQDIADKQLLAAGFLAPVFDAGTEACKDRIQRWKVNPEGGTGDVIWAESYTNAGQIPRFWDKDLKEIAKADLQFEPNVPRLTYKAKKYGFAPDFSKFSGPVNQDNAKQDMRFMADIMSKTSTLALEAVKNVMKEEFKVDAGMTVSGDTAKVAVKMSTEEKFSRTNFDGGRSCDTLNGTHLEILKFLLVRDGIKWVVLNIEGGGGDKISQEDFNKNVDMGSFGQSQILPIDLLAPLNQQEKAYNAKTQVDFKWKGSTSDSVKGYLFGIAEDNRFCGNRPPYGALIFVKAGKKGDTVSFTLDANAQVVGTNATAILRRAQDLRLPGWEKVMFEYTLPKLDDAVKGMAGVYRWKVIAVGDSSAAQFMTNGFRGDRFYGESDFGKMPGYFAVKSIPMGVAFTAIDQANATSNTQNNGAMGFGDMDQDGYPDFIEQKYGTRANDRNSLPDFRLDTDGDKVPDFLEAMLDRDGTLKLVTTKADETEAGDEIESLKELTPPIVIEDTDGDGFPNEIEQLLGFNPNDKFNNPGFQGKAEAPVGGFKGKLAMGDSKSDLSFSVSKDTSGRLMVAYTAIIGKDTLVDTVRANFTNQLIFQIILPKDGPNAGKSLWMRGNFEQFTQMLMGPCDIGPSADKNSLMINGGPQAGQWAASGRGEDVSNRLPGGNTGSNTNPTGTINTGTTDINYRTPPLGLSEKSTIEFTSDGGIVLVNEVGDTVAAIDTVQVRRQPNGFGFQAMKKTQFANGGKFIDLGGMMVLKGETWIIDGHVFVQYDSATVHKNIPGQFAFKADKPDIVVSGDNLVLAIGMLEGWVQQDNSGTGLTGSNNPPATTCPAGQTCNTTNPPATGFGRPFMAGVQGFRDNLSKMGVQPGATFYVSASGQVMAVVNDSSSIVPARTPWCGQLTVKGKLVLPATFPSDADKMKFTEMQQQMDRGTTILIVLEDPAMPGRLSILDKALDASGTIRTQVIGVEPRGVPADYLTNSGVCNPTNPNPGPIDTTKVGPGPGPMVPGYSGADSTVKRALQNSAGVVLWYDSVRVEHRVEVDPNSVGRDTGSKFLFVMSKSQPPQRLVFLNQNNNPQVLALSGNYPIVAPVGGTNPQNPPPPPPPDSTFTCPANQTCPPKDTLAQQGPVPFRGNMDIVKQLLTASSGVASLATGTAQLPVGTPVSMASLRLEAGLTLVNDASDDSKVYVVLGVAADPMKPMINPAGNQVVVAPRNLIAMQ